MKSTRTISTALCLTVCILLTALTGSLTGCTAIRSHSLSEPYNRTATEQGAVTDPFVAAMADFSMSLTQTTLAMESEGKANHLISPLSAMICLAMLANGAEGETLAQMETALGMPIDELNESLYAYTQGLYVGEDCKVSLADSIWYRDAERLTVKEDFLQTCADWYAAQQYATPFDETTRKDINNWVKKYTDGMIDTMLDDPIPPDTVMYLINALVFDAKWLVEYEKTAIEKREFTSLDGQAARVDTLHSDESTYLTLEGGQGFARPYKGGQYSFVGLLPDQGVNVYDLAATLDGAAWMAMWAERCTTTVRVRIPEFSYESFIPLRPVLEEMGITHLFDPDLADLTGMATSSAGNIYCSAVYQKTYIEVNRRGTKAAALTWAENKDCASPDVAEVRYVYLDRPFIYAIVDNQTGLPLFVGVVTVLS